MNAARAVIFAAHPWSGVPYGLHHMARGLARLGWQVLYVEPFFSPLHLAGGRRRGRVFGKAYRPTEEPGVFAISPFTLVPHLNLPLLRSPGTLPISRLLSWPFLGRKPFSGTRFAEPDLVLCGSPVATEMALSMGAGLSLYRLADDSSLFDVLTPAARRAEAEAISKFDVVITTSHLLVERAQQLKARQILLVSNGVDRGFFEHPAPIPPLIADLPEPRILYAGAVESWFDWQLIASSARERPAFSFVIIGGIGSPPPPDIPPNVHILGRQPYSEMPAFMQAANVGIIPFASAQRSEAVHAINPLKLYEYLAAGRPVVSSILPPDLSCEGLFVYSHSDDFLRCLDDAVALNRTGIRIIAPAHVDWAEILKDMLNKVGLAYTSS